MQSEEYKYATIVQTSQNKYQVILKLKKHITKEKAEQITKYLARKFNSDIAATDCTRLIRMPYTYNHKYDPPRLWLKSLSMPVLPIHHQRLPGRP